MVELFYTEHGLPIDKDKTYDYANRYQIAYLPANFDGNNYEDRPNDRSIKLHFNREPRFYSWIGFHNGNYSTSFKQILCTRRIKNVVQRSTWFQKRYDGALFGNRIS